VDFWNIILELMN